MPSITRPRETTLYDQKPEAPTKSTQEQDHTAHTSVNKKGILLGILKRLSVMSID